MSDIGGVVAQLRVITERLDGSAVMASRVQAETREANAQFTEAGRGTAHPAIRQAVSESRTADEKAGKVARLLSEAAGHLAAYMQVIAPGSAPSRHRASEGPPSGEHLVREAEDKGGNVDRFIRRHVKKADQTEGNLQNAETVATDGVKKLFSIYKGKPGSTGTETSAPQPPPIDRPQVEHPATAVIISVGAAAVGIRRAWAKMKQRRGRKARGDQT
ncbi:hypothetical protein ACQEVC_05920 [Plantactinospora sp. CA-294935]|uniref:hypothetical protein n=1 Tax=Plantactinospora sp. CA-294935 TaxID=3240012 RepID=UPI003D8BD7F6